MERIMNGFRIYLLSLLVVVAAYTVVVIATEGWNLFPEFFGAIRAMQWPGQFNLDFMGMLSLSALWVAWRHEFGTSGIVLGLCAFFGGVLFLAGYLVFQSFRDARSIPALLLGPKRLKAIREG